MRAHAKLLAAVGGDDALVVLGPDPYTNPMRSLNSGRIAPAMSLDDEGWRVFAQGTDHAARRVMEETGLRSVLHHHTGTWIETPEETARILEMTDAEIVGLVFDTGHWAFGGGDPLAASANSPIASGMCISRIMTRRCTSNRGFTNGMVRNRWARASSPSSGGAMSISPVC